MIDALEELCRAVAPDELKDAPIYVVMQSSLPADFALADDCFGYTAPALDLYLQDHIHCWLGRGPCLVLNDVVLAEEYEPADMTYLMQAYALHELGHILNRPKPYRDCSGVSPERIQFERLVLADVLRCAPAADLPAYFGHEASFIRIVLHLRHRAELAGVCIAPALPFFGYSYGLSHASRYLAALGDEPANMTRCPFQTILATQVPAAFSRLWNEDLIAYHQRFPQHKGIAT